LFRRTRANRFNTTVTQSTRHQQTQCRAQRSHRPPEALEQEDAIFAAGPSDSERSLLTSRQLPEAPNSSDTIDTMRKEHLQAQLGRYCGIRARGKRRMAHFAALSRWRKGQKNILCHQQFTCPENKKKKKPWSLRGQYACCMLTDRLNQFLQMLSGSYDGSSAPKRPRRQVHDHPECKIEYRLEIRISTRVETWNLHHRRTQSLRF
jgi:hypothetical protein